MGWRCDREHFQMDSCHSSVCIISQHPILAQFISLPCKSAFPQAEFSSVHVVLTPLAELSISHAGCCRLSEAHAVPWHTRSTLRLHFAVSWLIADTQHWLLARITSVCLHQCCHKTSPFAPHFLPLLPFTFLQRWTLTCCWVFWRVSPSCFPRRRFGVSPLWKHGPGYFLVLN